MKCNTREKEAIKLKCIVKSVLVLFFLVLLSNPLAAQKFDECDLTAADVKQFIKEYPAVIKEFEEKNIAYDDKKNSDLTGAAASKYLNDVNKIVKKHGYKDYMDFTTKSVTIIMSYGSLKMNEDSSSSNAEMQKALQEIENSDEYTAEQKAQMKQMFQQTTSAMQSMADEDNVKVVKPFEKQLEAIIEEEK